MNGLYADTLEEGFVFDGKVLQEAIRKIYGKDFNTLTDIERGWWNEFWKAFNEATDTGFHKQSPFQDDYAFYRELRYNNAVFAAFKAHRFQNDIASQLLDEDGQHAPGILCRPVPPLLYLLPQLRRKPFIQNCQRCQRLRL